MEHKKVKPCICPGCGKKFENYFKYSEGMEFSDDDTIFIDYNCHCECGTKFIYTEWYYLNYTEIEEI